MPDILTRTLAVLTTNPGSVGKNARNAHDERQQWRRELRYCQSLARPALTPRKRCERIAPGHRCAKRIADLGCDAPKHNAPRSGASHPARPAPVAHGTALETPARYGSPSAPTSWPPSCWPTASSRSSPPRTGHSPKIAWNSATLRPATPASDPKTHRTIRFRLPYGTHHVDVQKCGVMLAKTGIQPFWVRRLGFLQPNRHAGESRHPAFLRGTARIPPTQPSCRRKPASSIFA